MRLSCCCRSDAPAGRLWKCPAAVKTGRWPVMAATLGSEGPFETPVLGLRSFESRKTCFGRYRTFSMPINNQLELAPSRCRDTWKRPCVHTLEI